MIRVENLTKRYGSTVVVDDVSFTVGPGEAIALWGPNGAGKSTIMRCLLGSIRFEGTVEIGGNDVVRRGKAARRLIGYVPQHLSFYDDLTVAETMALSAQLRRADQERARELLERVELADHWSKRVGALSGGMKQRLGIALALVADPPVLMLDEPTASLDVASRASVLQVFESLRDDRRAVVLTSHHLDEVGVLTDRVLAMEDGVPVLECAPGELAQKLGLRVWMHVTVAEDQISQAADALDVAGFEIRRNSHGVLVEVAAGEKGKALSHLNDAGVGVMDVDVWR